MSECWPRASALARDPQARDAAQQAPSTSCWGTVMPTFQRPAEEPVQRDPANGGNVQSCGLHVPGGSPQPTPIEYF